MTLSDKFPWATLLGVLLTVIAAVVGGAVVVWGDPGALSFNDYLNDMSKFVIGIGVLGIGRGILAAKK